MPPAAKAVVVLGLDGTRIAEAVVALRAAGLRVAGYVGDDEAEARSLAVEMLGGVDEVVRT